MSAPRGVMRGLLPALAALLVLALVWWGLDAPRQESAGIEPRTAASFPIEESRRESEPELESVMDREAAASEREPFSPISLSGMVVWPAGSAPDSDLEVVASFSITGGGAQRLATTPTAEGGFSFVAPAGAKRCRIGVRSESFWLPGEPILDASHGYVFDAASLDLPSVLLRLAAYGRIEGRILRGAGVDVASEAITVLLSFEDSPRFSLLTKEQRSAEVVDDRFTFDGLRSDETLHLSVAAPDCFGKDCPELQIPSGETLQVDLELLAAACVEGRVLTSDGEAIPRARVSAFEADTRLYEGRAGDDAFSDSEGRFCMTRVQPGRTVLEAQVSLGERAAGGLRRPRLLDEISEGRGASSWFMWSEELGELLAGTTTQVDLIAPAVRELTGRVIWPDGRPARGALMRARLPCVGHFPLHAGEEWGKLGESGAFQLAVAETGPSEIFVGAAAEDGRRWFAQWIKAPADPLPAEPLELVLALGREISVRVLDDTGQIASNVLLQSNHRGAGSLCLEDERGWISDGEVRLQFPPGGGLLVQAIHEPTALPIVGCAWSQGDAEPLVLVVPRLCRVSGEVAGARELFLTKVRILSRWPSAQAGGGDCQSERWMRLDEGGRFVFEDLPPGKTWLWIEGRKSDAIHLELAPGESRSEIVLYP